MLISISGIGPKLAVSILSGVELEELKSKFNQTNGINQTFISYK